MWTDCYVRPGEPDYIAPANETENSDVPICGHTPRDYGVPICTREVEHDGNHAAHTVDNAMISTWDSSA